MATVSTNVGKPKKKKKTDTPVVKPAGGVRPFTVKSEGKTELSATPGKTTKEYTHARVHTGHKAYGKENPKNADPAHVHEARAKKKDISYDAEGKPYRAGHTTTKETPPKANITTPKITIGRVEKKESVKPKTPASEIRQKGGKPPVRKMIRVEYLRDKDAKGGISKERHRPKKEAGY